MCKQHKVAEKGTMGEVDGYDTGAPIQNSIIFTQKTGIVIDHKCKIPGIQ